VDVAGKVNLSRYRCFFFAFLAGCDGSTFDGLVAVFFFAAVSDCFEAVESLTTLAAGFDCSNDGLVSAFFFFAVLDGFEAMLSSTTLAKCDMQYPSL